MILPIELPHLIQLESLSFHHKDPFDKLIAATAIDMGLAVLSLDPNIAKYPLKTIW